MSKHFEDVWCESEKLSAGLMNADRNIDNVIRHCALLKEILKLRNSDDDENSFSDNNVFNHDLHTIIGDLLFFLSGISKEYNINVWTALIDSTNGFKIDTYEE